MLYGAHVSSAGGMVKTISRGEALGCTAIQTFASSPRSIQFTAKDDGEIAAYREARAVSSIACHVFHGVYLINLAHENKEYVNLCEKSLIGYQQLAGKMGVLGTVFHIGSHKGAGLDAVIKQVAMSIFQVLKSTPPGVWLLLENAAGQKGTIGRNIKELGVILREVKLMGGEMTKLGIGVDTQHAFASGYAIDTKAGLDDFAATIETEVGFDKLKLVHVNDSKVAYNSHRDRHENLGEGMIGLANLKRFVNHPKFKKLPFILEVPGKDKKGPGKKDVATLKALFA